MKKNLLLLAGSLLVAFVLAEVFLRLVGFSYPNFYRYDVNTGATLRAGATGWWAEEGESLVRINSHGMRDDREPSIEKPANVYRIAVLGDSYAEALQIDVSKTFWRLLEQELEKCHFADGGRIEVLNFGVSGYSTAQELLTLKHRVKPFKPDLVLLAFLSGNDVRDNSKEFAGSYPRPYYQLVDGQLIEDMSFREHWIFNLKSSLPWLLFQAASDYSRFIQLLNKVKNIAGQPLSAPGKKEGSVEEIGLDEHIYLSNPPQIWEHAWVLTEALVAEVKREAERQGARFLLVTLTNPGQVPPDREMMLRHAQKLGEPDLFYPERRMLKFSQQQGINAVFLAEAFADYAAARYLHLHGFANTQMGGGHWNEHGHELASKIIAKQLCKINHTID